MILLEAVILILRFAAVLILYLFLWQAVRLIYRDLGLRRNQKGDNADGTASVPEVSAADETAAELIVLAAAANAKPALGSLLPLGSDNCLGRSDGNDIVLDDPFASGRHARIFKSRGRFWLTDLGSRNGTFLNGMVISRPTALRNGDILKIGGMTLQFVRWNHEDSIENRYRSDPGEK